MTTQIINGNCLELMKKLEDKSVDLFICDLPYGETNCKWDCKIDLDEFWKEFKRIRKSKRTACIHFCSTKFGYTLIKSNEKMFKMDMVWKKRNKTGGLQSRHRPMRNHEMVYFFYEQAPKYNRDKYHKRIVAVPTFKKDEKNVYGNNKEKNTMGTNSFKPPNPASVLEEKKNKTIKAKDRKAMGESSGIYSKENQTASSFKPPNPASVVEEKDTEGQKKAKVWGYEKCTKSFDDNEKVNGGRRMGANFEPPNPVSVVEEKDIYGETKKERKERRKKGDSNFEPPNPASVVEEKDPRINEKGKSPHGWDIEHMDKPRVAHFDPKLPVSVLEEKTIYSQEISGGKNGHGYNAENCKNFGTYGFEPPNPASVVEENAESNKVWGYDKPDTFKISKDGTSQNFHPKLPASVVEEFIVPAEDEPKSMFESTKVFIGKRHHQTEKPQDILEFFLKYWTDEGDTVLDPTMGSGSTGVACKKLKRNFIGYELDPAIFKVAEKRLDVKII